MQFKCISRQQADGKWLPRARTFTKLNGGESESVGERRLDDQLQHFKEEADSLIRKVCLDEGGIEVE